MLNINEVLAMCADASADCHWAGDDKYVELPGMVEQLAAEYRKVMEVVEAAQYRQMLINNRRELRLRNRPGEFIPELGDLIVSIGQADIRLEQALAGLEG